MHWSSDWRGLQRPEISFAYLAPLRNCIITWRIDLSGITRNEKIQTLKSQNMLDLINAIPFPDWISDTAVKIGPISIKWYGISYIVGLYLAYFYARKTLNNRPIWHPRQNTTSSMKVPDHKTLEDFLFYCLVGIIVGGRLGYIILYGLPEYLQEPVRIFKVWEGGMSFHGGFLGVVLATVIL
ncbi:MAG TPA: prolipoprotein diacylglyceryl transferase, partial [Hellea balneolensis]|nr:prolipoprotein diacylglyceryl transferase [Hellea balneolensis]